MRKSFLILTVFLSVPLRAQAGTEYYSKYKELLMTKPEPKQSQP